MVRWLSSICGTMAALLAAVVAASSAKAATPDMPDDAIVQPLEGRTGNADRGRAIALDRATGNCLICHKVPIPSELFQGELGPDLAGVAARLSADQLRLRLVDQSRLNPGTMMPPYYRTGGLMRVAAPFQGKPVLTAQEIEDVVAWLATLK